MLVQACLCRTCSETTLLVFPRGGLNDNVMSKAAVHYTGYRYIAHLYCPVETFNGRYHGLYCAISDNQPSSVALQTDKDSQTIHPPKIGLEKIMNHYSQKIHSHTGTLIGSVQTM